MSININRNRMDKVILTDPMTQLNNDFNLKKYKDAGGITAKVLDKLVKLIVPNARVYDICIEGDRTIIEETNKIYKNIKNKGIAFPTSISINNIASHYSPSKQDNTVIKEGDIVKIELGVHIDGFPALIVYTVIVNTLNKPITDKRANVVKACALASKEVINLMRPGKTNIDVVKVLEKYAKKYDCSIPFILYNTHAPGIVSYQISQYVIDGFNDDDDEYIHRLILNREHDAYEFTLRETEFEYNEVYAIDITFITGNGKLSEKDNEKMIYKRIQDMRVPLKTSSGKNVLNEFGNERFPINVRDISIKGFRLGLSECVRKGLIKLYPVLETNNNEYVARVKFTVIVRDKPILITGRSANEQLNKIHLHH